MSLAARVVFGGQELSAAIPAFIYGLVWAQWQFGWLWEPINRGNQMYGDHIEERKAALAASKELISKGLRLHDERLTLKGTRALADLYTNSEQGPVREILQTATALESSLARLKVEELAAFRTELARSTELQSNLRRALRSGDESLIREARAAMDTYVTSLKGQNPVAETQAAGLRLLEHSLATPPYATRPLPGLEWGTTMVGAFVTTLWATSMSVMTFRTDISWTEKILEAGMWSAALYAGAYYGQKGVAVILNKGKTVVTNVRDRLGQAKPRMPVTCEAVFGGN
jgi:hypothetical protein